MTKASMIRNMTDNELSDFLAMIAANSENSPTAKRSDFWRIFLAQDVLDENFPWEVER